MAAPDPLHAKAIHAIDYLISKQKNNGSWCDYCLPVGESDQWVTAFTGLGVAQISRKLGYQNGFDAAHRAARFLQDFQEYDSGWGYNRHVGVDADSTAHAIRLFRELNIPVETKDEECLMAHYDGSGGFSTYRVDSMWGNPHPDVTASAGLALNDRALQHIREDLLRYCSEVRLPNGIWPTFWWRNHQYGTFYMLELHERIGALSSIGHYELSVKIQSCFDLAWTIGIVLLYGCGASSTGQMLEVLWQMQQPSGAWPESPSLRVTDPTCRHPWICPEGSYYADINRTITTSSVLRILARIDKWL